MRFEDCPDDPTKVRIKMNEYCIPKPWVGLTEDEIHDLRIQTLDNVATNYEVYKAIEAKLKEKNGG